jgi:hypothetical protein
MTESTIKVLTFAGTKREWSPWKEKFLARAAKKGYREILVKDGLTIPRTGTTIDETTAPGVVLERNKKMNEAAYDDLILSMDIDKPGG